MFSLRPQLYALLFCVAGAYPARAQTYTWTSSTEGHLWQQAKVSLQKTAATPPVLEVKGDEKITTFKAWGTCFNELGWDALQLLPAAQQATIMGQLFQPGGDLRFSQGRFAMNANDYARAWYSCDEVDGDFQLKHFNIDHDKTTLIPYIKAAQRQNPALTFWISPWSPPSWMKINHHYAVRSDAKFNQLAPAADGALYEASTEKTPGVFPDRLAVNDYLIQDPRYLTAYANYFCKFIAAYQEQGIPITKAMFQNESWSYTPYPGCAWTAPGIIRFNTEYLAPALKAQHPGVALFLGTINTNRYDVIDQVLSDPRMAQTVQGVGLQWEGGQLLARLRAKYPQYRYMQSESECGWGSFDWKAAEHTFSLMTHYLGNGCEEYTFWNAILADKGVSPWGWQQNALIQVDSKTKAVTYTPEYYATKHFSHFIGAGTTIVAAHEGQDDKLPVLVAATAPGKYVVLAGNLGEASKSVSVKLGGRYLTATLPAHSFHTFQVK
ncbi:MAG: beta-glycosidase [Hymenobacter sp.]|nr:MAG: beta-glycosidase [Hymenobacter sp.]